METAIQILFRDRSQAGKMLAQRLTSYCNTDTIIVGISHGGVCVAAAVAQELHLPLDVLPCEKILHPSNNKRTIGSLTAGEISLHDGARSIPQDYLSHQIKLLRSTLQTDAQYYHDGMIPHSFAGKRIIIVDDIVENADNIRSAVLSIKKDDASSVVVAAPVIVEGAILELIPYVVEVVYQHKVEEINLWDSFYVEFPQVSREEVRRLLLQARVNNRSDSRLNIQ